MEEERLVKKQFNKDFKLKSQQHARGSKSSRKCTIQHTVGGGVDDLI